MAFDGSARRLVAHMLENEALRDRAEIRRMLDFVLDGPATAEDDRPSPSARIPEKVVTDPPARVT